MLFFPFFFFFFFNDTATTEIYTLSLHDALPICLCPATPRRTRNGSGRSTRAAARVRASPPRAPPRSEEHTSELQSLAYLVCRLLLEKKKKNISQLIVTLHLEHPHMRPYLTSDLA